MPSPVGHLLGGAIVGLLVEPAAVLVIAIAGAAPDVDFLWGRHNAETHSLGAAVLTGAVVLGWARWANLKVCPHPYRLALAVTLAWSSHVLFDWLGSDDTPPLGVMALWPLNSTYYFAHAYFFEAISRRYWLSNFWSHNLYAVAKEVLILGPVLVALRVFRSRALRRFRRRDTT
ncbi:MAG: metal-dependent hydrolase [Vicinamibacterales bacterium]